MDASAPYDEFFVADQDPEYKYKWCNARERVMFQRSRQGYEVVQTPEAIPEAIKLISPPVEGVPTSVVRRRGDLVLMRIKRDLWERNVNGPIQAAKERSHVSSEAMLDAANDAARRALRARGIPDSQIPKQMVFLDSSDGKAGA